MGIPMASTEEQVERCDLCGTPLFLSSGAPGCLNCLLAGGRDGAEERRYQHYEVTVREDGMTPSELGRGAMGITYRALDLNLGAPVALKVISARYSNQREARDRFRREAQDSRAIAASQRGERLPFRGDRRRASVSTPWNWSKAKRSNRGCAARGR